MIAALSVLLLTAVTAGFYARQQSDEAIQQRNRAIASQVSDTANTVSDRPLSGFLALISYRLAPLPQTRGAVLSARTWQTGTRLSGHRNAVWATTFNPDGRLSGVRVR
ncbi:hypothetical protein ACSDR0_43035 [Streptosporangium sp. G11]|uniref:hypothetical protein n=1 Tax=Streptosporangium sp. G11 TaxID=3436926 RepID=UPI003EBDE786